nr:ribonuclease H-like domain-containing protein [Tanacetum cinerariifolium]
TDENTTNLPINPPTPQAPHTLSTIKLSILKKEGLHKGYVRFQSLLSQLKTHGAGVSTEDANQKFLSGPKLDHEDLEQLNEFDLEEMDLKWHVAMISMRLMKFYKKTRRKLHFDAKKPVCFDKNKDESKAVVTIDGKGIDWTSHAKEDTKDYALMAFNSSNSGSDTESKSSKSNAKTNDLAYCESTSSVETLESVPKPVKSKPKAVSEPKVWFDAPIIEEYESDSNDENVFKVTVEQEIPSCASIDTVKHVKSPRQTVKLQDTCSQNPKVDKRDWTGLKSKRQGLGYGYTRKTCFVCGSFSHLIRDYDFHEKRMAKQVKLNKSKNKVTFQRKDRPVWNNMQRLNHQNKFVPIAVLTKTGRFPVNASRQSFSSQAASTSTVSKVNTARPIVNEIRPINNMYKSHSTIRRPFNKTTTPKANFANHKVNTAGDKTVSAVGGIRETAVKASAGCNWRSKRHYWKKFQNTTVDQNLENVILHQTLKGKCIVNSGCSKYMTGNKAYLVEYQDFNSSLVSFGGSKDQITDIECLVSHEFKFPDENQVLLRIPRQHNVYSFNLEHIIPSGGLACLIAKAIVDESNKWHWRFSHVNFKNLNKLVKGNLVRGLPFKIFQNDHPCVASHKRKQHKASWIKKEYSNAKTLQQNGVAERKNMTLIKAARTMLADLFLPNTFWAETVSTACYVLNRVLVTKLQNKTPYELLTGKIPIISYIRPFGCHVTILNTIDHLGKFEEKSDGGFLVGYSLNSKAFRPVTVENKANKTAGPKEANNSAEAKNGELNLNEDTSSKTNKEPVYQGDQAFLEELDRLKRQENEANDAAAQGTKDLLFQAGTARASSTNYVNAASTTINTAGTPINTASSLRNDKDVGPSSPDQLTYANQDDSQIPNLKDIYEVPNDGIFTNASYDTNGAVADFTNLESTMNVSPIPQSRIYSIHPTTQILGDPNSSVQTRGKGRKYEKFRVVIQFEDLMFFIIRIKGYIWFVFSKIEKFRQGACIQTGEDKKAKTRLNIKECNFNKLDDLVGEGGDYAVNKGKSTNKIKVLNAETEGVSAGGKTLSTATLVVSTVSV